MVDPLKEDNGESVKVYGFRNKDENYEITNDYSAANYESSDVNYM